MREKIFAMSLGVVFSLPTVIEAFKLPMKSYTNKISNEYFKLNYRIVSLTKEKNDKDEDILTSVPSGEAIVINTTTDSFEIENSSLPEVEENNSIENVANSFLPFEVRPDKLQTFSYNVSSELPEGYSNSFNFDGKSNYDEVQGISTFRGNNYRDSAFYGSLNVTQKTLEKVWTNNVGQTDKWTGIGWNGQPSIIKWSDDVKNQMNLYNEFKLKENFTEVIYGGLDSMVHFYDLDTGLPCRPSIHVPSSIKGSVTVDPRGYPLLYVGQGINEVSGVSVKFGYHIFSLITGEELYFIDGRDKFAFSSWGAFDGNPVIDAKTDTLILPGENGVVYVVKLNTNYDSLNGTISISPVATRYRYKQNGRAGGMENAIAIYEHYAFFANNNGVVQCLDLNTLTPVWSYNMEDDCDATIGIEEEGEDVFLYVACEVDKRKQDSPAYVKKLNARTGDVVWQFSCNCKYDPNVNGGVLSSPVIGKNSISNLVIFNFSKVTKLSNGKMVALDKTTGNVVWEKDLTYYSWSSPVAIYTESGEAYLVFGDCNGIMNLIDAKTGETVFKLQTGGGNMEGSPAVFNNHIVIGTRGKKVFRIDIF